MDKQKWWQELTPQQKRNLADAVNSSRSTMSQMFNGHRNCSTNRAKKIVRAAEKLEVGNQLTRSMLRPDVWANDQAA